MNVKTVFLATLAFLLALPAVSYSQKGDDNPLDPSPSRKQILIGPTVSVNRNYHSGGFRTIADDPSCPVFQDGNGWGFGVGLSAEFLPSINGTWGIIPRITFEQRPGQFNEELPNAEVLLPNPDPNADPEIVSQTVSTSSDIVYTILNAEVMYKQEVLILDGLRIGVLGGPAFGYVIGGTIRQVQDLETPENARFINNQGLVEENNGRTLVFADGDIPARSSTRFSLKAGVQGEFGLFGNQWIMTPGVYYDYGLTEVTDTESWNLSSIIFQVDMRRAF